jgi:hypothetical protein
MANVSGAGSLGSRLLISCRSRSTHVLVYKGWGAVH